jgi:hypothetical protein
MSKAQETVIYGLAQGETREYMEQLLYDGGQLLSDEQIQMIRELATADGFHAVRVWTFKHGMKVDFASTIA